MLLHEGVYHKAKRAKRPSSFKEAVISNVIIQHLQLHHLTTNVMILNAFWGYFSEIN